MDTSPDNIEAHEDGLDEPEQVMSGKPARKRLWLRFSFPLSDVAKVGVAGMAVVGAMAVAAKYGVATPNELMLTYLFAAVICCIIFTAIRYSRHDSTDGLGVSLATIAAVSGVIVVTLIALSCFYFLPVW